jgi:hypothetical protein
MHPGQHPNQGRMTAEDHMMYEFYWQQMMLNEMMRPSRPYGGSPSARTRPMQPNAGQTHQGQNSGSNPRQPSQIKAAQPNSPGSAQPGNKLSGGNTGKTNSSHSESKELNREKRREEEKLRKKTGPATGHRARTNDNATIAMLKTVHSRLRGADADYDGHRVRAMGHIASAIHHLDTTSGASIGMVDGYNGGMGFGGGNMPQAESDGILRDAEYQLNKMLASLPTGTNAAAHHNSAHLSVTEAIHELQTALKIR